MQCPIPYSFLPVIKIAFFWDYLHNTFRAQACRHRCILKVSLPDVIVMLQPTFIITRHKDGLVPLIVQCLIARAVTTLHLCLISITQNARKNALWPHDDRASKATQWIQLNLAKNKLFGQRVPKWTVVLTLMFLEHWTLQSQTKHNLDEIIQCKNTTNCSKTTSSFN